MSAPTDVCRNCDRPKTEHVRVTLRCFPGSDEHFEPADYWNENVFGPAARGLPPESQGEAHQWVEIPAGANRVNDCKWQCAKCGNLTDHPDSFKDGCAPRPPHPKRCAACANGAHEGCASVGGTELCGCWCKYALRVLPAPQPAEPCAQGPKRKYECVWCEDAADAASDARIAELEAEIDRLKHSYEVRFYEQRVRCAELELKLSEVTRERDAAVAEFQKVQQLRSEEGRADCIKINALQSRLAASETDWERLRAALEDWVASETARQNAVDAYNLARNEMVKRQEVGDWRTKVHAEFAAIGDSEHVEHTARKALYAAALAPALATEGEAKPSTEETNL